MAVTSATPAGPASPVFRWLVRQIRKSHGLSGLVHALIDVIWTPKSLLILHQHCRYGRRHTGLRSVLRVRWHEARRRAQCESDGGVSNARIWSLLCSVLLPFEANTKASCPTDFRCMPCSSRYWDSFPSASISTMLRCKRSNSCSLDNAKDESPSRHFFLSGPRGSK
jgi:hypothetical protein